MLRFPSRPSRTLRCSALSAMLACVPLVAGTVSGAAGAAPLQPAAAQSQRLKLGGPLHAQYQQVLRQRPPAESRDLPAQQRGDPLALAITLPELAAELRARSGTLDSLTAAALLASAQDLERARALLQRGGPGIGYLADVLRAMAVAQARLEALTRSRPGDIAGMLGPGLQRAHDAARLSATNLVALARRRGVATERLAAAGAAIARGDALRAAGSFSEAIGPYAEGLDLVGGGLRFDLDLMVAGLRGVLDAEAVGYAYAVGAGGLLARSGSNGLARTGTDAPVALQASNRKMHVASVSKTLTAIVVLDLLAERGLTPDEPIGPWLPSAWARGTGVDQLSFRQVMRHESGFGQNAAPGSSFPNLQIVIGRDVGDTGFDYDNANFGLMRVLAAGLMGIDVSQYGEFDGGALSSAAFLLRAKQRYGAIGVDFSCDPDAAKPTLIYPFPDGGVAGYAHPGFEQSCGGFGVFVSAEEIAATLAHLRHGAPWPGVTVRVWMDQHYLGLMNPARYGFAEGIFGEYFSHGGDWTQGSGRLDTCHMSFHNGVEVALVINSSPVSGKYLGGIYSQCGLLKRAFENAWVAT